MKNISMIKYCTARIHDFMIGMISVLIVAVAFGGLGVVNCAFFVSGFIALFL